MKKTILTFLVLVFPMVTHHAFAADEAARQTAQEKEKIQVDQEKQKFLALFKRLDTNGDGGLSKDELAKTHSSRFSLMTANFDQMDANKDGKVTLEELYSWQEAQLKEQLEQMDTNHDGKVSPEERQAWMYTHGK